MTFSGEKCSILWTSRLPTTMSALPATIGATSLGMSSPSYWLSPSVLTITSAPSFRHASRPAWKPAARPLLFVSRTMWSTPPARATSIVLSVEPSSMISHSTCVEAVDAPGQVREHERKCLLLVEAGDLDDQLHAVGPRGILTFIEVSSVPSATSPAPVASPSPAEAPAGAVAGCPRSAPPSSRSSPSARSRSPPSSATSSTRRIRTTTRTTRCCGGASSSAWTRSRSPPTARPPSIRSRSPSARC